MRGFEGERLFLSNFDTTPFFLPALGCEVPSGEHGFNALKTVNPVQRQLVLDAPTPSKAKYVGRSVTLRPGWDTGLRVRAMQSVQVAKFAVPDLGERLLATGDEPLVEVNTWHDQFWGTCECPRHAPHPGVNMLGELLMALRAKTRL